MKSRLNLTIENSLLEDVKSYAVKNKRSVSDLVEKLEKPSIIGYWLTTEYGNTKAKKLLLTILSDITVIDIPHEIILNALHSKITDIEDALQYYTAIHHKLDYFISLDKKLQKQSIPTLPVYTPEEFLKEM